MGIIRLLFLADTHLGYDLPFRPRIQRRRRGPEFFANFKLALLPALQGRVDCVVHGGDLLYRSKVSPRLVAMAFEPLKQVADRGTPVYLVPGNHERSAIPHRHLAEHPRIHIFDRPRTYLLRKDDFTLALAGFPFVRHGIRSDFLDRLDQTGRRHVNADVQVLCIHQSVDGATVGPSGYMFRYAPDVIQASDIPTGFTAVLSGHIHRFQVLANDLEGNALQAPVYYPGAIERTSFAEKNETKGYLTLEFEADRLKSGRLIRWQFHELPTRPMIQLNLHPREMRTAELRSWIANTIRGLPQDGIVRLKIHGRISQDAMAVLRAASLRTIAPPTMNIDTAFKDYNFF
jgi:DNA repair exonuclease SbcCD nuclease subunit